MKSLKTFEFPASRVGKGQYEWAKLLNGGIYQLEEEKDYKCKTISFLALARMAAKKAGKTLKASKVDGGVVIQAMQITKPE